MKTLKKILIVGAGPAGLACAQQILTDSFLEMKTFDVTIMDKKLKVGENPRCAGGISLWMVEKAEVKVPESCIVAMIRNVRIYAPDGNYWEFRSDKPYGYIINREPFEQDMAKRVEEFGGKFLLGREVFSDYLERSQKVFNYIVGADGYPSTVSSWVRAQQPESYDVHHCFQKEIVWDSFPKNTIEVYFGSKVAPKGYLWLFSAGENKVRAGLGVPLSERANLRGLLDNFLERQVYDYTQVNMVSKLIPTVRPRGSNVFLDGRVLLVGDAGLFCDPATGGGIIQGIASGKAAGRAIAEGKPLNYNNYAGWLKKQNGRRYRLKKVLYSFSDKDLNTLIEVMKGFTPKSMSIGKEIRRACLHLLWHKPRLSKKFLKYLR